MITSKIHRPRSTLRLLAGVLVTVVMVALTLTVSTNFGTAGATTPVTTITVCTKGIVTGSFPFALNGGATFAVAANQCVSKPVDAGENLVTELTDPTGATKLQSIVVSPQSANVVHKVKNSKSQAGYAKVDVTSGADVKVTFWNERVIGQLKVCTIAESSVLVGQYFTFTEQAGATTVGPFSVQAEPAGTSLKCGGRTSYPVGSKVTVSESGETGVTVTITGEITVGGGDGCGDGGSAVTTVGNKGTTIVDFTNAAPTCGPPTTGYLEVCVQAGDASVGTGPWTFTISGNGQSSQTESVLTGQCSGDVPLPVGAYTVTETFARPDSVSSITGDPTAPVSTNLAIGSGVFNLPGNLTETATFTNDG